MWMGAEVYVWMDLCVSVCAYSALLTDLYK